MPQEKLKTKMTLNERILDFMEGSLPPDEEAELLHRLSVSPEKRDLLRSFMNQKALFARDRQSIVVPYKAEQALWKSLGTVMPAMEEAGTESVRIAPIPLFSRIFNTVSASVGIVTLMIGLGAGYFAGMHQSPVSNMAAVANQTSVQSVVTPTITTPLVERPALRSNRSELSSHRIAQITPSSVIVPATFSSNLPAVNIGTPAPAVLMSENTNRTEQPDHWNIAGIEPKSTGPVSLDRIGGDGNGIQPMFQHNLLESQVRQKSLLQRFEFSINESFGRQFPNSDATNVSLPLITNSSIGAFFQVLPRSDLLWVGASYGTANVTHKNLFTRAGDPTDPLQNVLTSDTVHAQTSYVASFVQLRLPAFEAADLTFTAGYGLANIGQMMMGELGLHYDVSREVGLQLGLRVLRFSYDLTGEREAAIKSGAGSLVVPNAVEAASYSFNTELNTGLYFHF